MQGKYILLKDMLLIRGKWNYIFHNLRMKQHFPQFREKEALANYAKIPENFGINFDFHPRFPEWLAFRKFDDLRIFRKLSVCSALVSKRFRNVWLKWKHPQCFKRPFRYCAGNCSDHVESSHLTKFIDWFNFETRPSSLCTFGMAYLNPLELILSSLWIKSYSSFLKQLCFAAFSHSKILTAVSSSLYILMVLSASHVISRLLLRSKVIAKIPASLSSEPGCTDACRRWKLYPVRQSQKCMVPLSPKIQRY